MSGVFGRENVPERGRIRGVLFDSGDTLVRPVGRSWSPGHRFLEILESHGVRDLDPDRLEEGLQAGMRYLNPNLHVPTETEERLLFQSYYGVVLETMGLAPTSGDLTLELASAMVDDMNIETFPETRTVMADLRQKGIALSVISNAFA